MGKRPFPLTLVILITLIIIVMEGCHGLARRLGESFYNLQIENHLPKPLTVRVPWHEFEIGACSAFVRYAVPGPPASIFDVEAFDAEGNTVYAASVELTEQESDLLQLRIKISGDEESACPPLVEDAYMLIIHNWTGEDLPIRHAGRDVGIVPARTERTFGPFAGSWRTPEWPTVPDASGDDRLRRPGVQDLRPWVGPVEFPLGSVPTLIMDISASSSQ